MFAILFNIKNILCLFCFKDFQGRWRIKIISMEHKGVEHVIPSALVVIMMQCRGWSMMLQMGWGRWWMKNVPSRRQEESTADKVWKLPLSYATLR